MKIVHIHYTYTLHIHCGHTQSRKHYEASMKIVHVRHENCGCL